MNKGTLIKNGIDFSNGGGSGSVSIDYGNIDEFNTWSETAKDGEIFVRTDDNESSGGGGGSNVAKDILYNNSLTQLDATNIQDAIDEVFQSVSDGKVLIADAITDKGIETSATDTFAIMAENIISIKNDGTEIKTIASDVKITDTASQILTFDVSGRGITNVDNVILKLKQVHTTTGGSNYDLNYNISISDNILTITHGALTGSSFVIVDILYVYTREHIIPYHKYLVETIDISGSQASLRISQYDWNYNKNDWELLESNDHHYKKGNTDYFGVIRISYSSSSYKWTISTLVPTVEYPIAQVIGNWSYLNNQNVFCTRYDT